MIKLDKLTPDYKQNVLISINALVDIDIGLLKLIKEEYLDPKVFNVKYFEKADMIDYIRTTYFRKADNPLYYISINPDHHLLDEYYIEFCKTQYEEIYDRSVYTDLLPMINLFLESGEISIAIMYYKDYSLTKLKEDQEAGILNNKITFIDGKNLKGNIMNNFNQIYLRSVTEFNILPIAQMITPKTFYISSFGPNFGENGDIKRNDNLNKIMTGKIMHEIATFDMYNMKNFRARS